MSTAARRALPALLLILVALAVPALASAHAQLEGSNPARGAVVKEEPSAVAFSFDEPVEGNFGAVRVYDADGARVDEGDAFHPGGEGRRIAVHLKPGLADGSYTATYRVVSADGHIISSGIVFSIGKAGKAPAKTVAELTAGAETGPVTQTAFGIARGLQYAALAIAVGSLAFLLSCWLPALARVGSGGGPWAAAGGAFDRRLRVVLLVSAAVGAVSAAAAVVLEGAEAAGISGFSATREAIVREALGTKFGTVWGLAALAWLGFAVLAAIALHSSSSRPRPALLGLPLLPLAFLVSVAALSGHGSTQSPVALLFGANVLHVLAMAVWLGGLAALLAVVPPGTRQLAAGDRSRLLAAVLARFSQLALISVAVVLLTGLIQAYVYVRHPGALVDSGYGRAVLAKFLLLLAVIALGAYNRRRSVPRLREIAAGGDSPGHAGLLLRRALRAEVALLVVVLGVTAALASYAPPVNAQAGPFSVETQVGPVLLEVTVEPASAGPNELHVYLFDATTGAPFAAVKELTVTASLPDQGISLPLQPQVSGPGHYTVPRALLSVAGEWQIVVVARVSAFDQYETTIEVPVG